jgi:hypothetical protein
MKLALQFPKIYFLALLFLISSSQAYASGLGVSGSIGLESWTRDENYSGDRLVSNIGFVFDTAVRRNRLFGYRFTFQREQNKSDGGKLDMHGWAIANDFQFGLVRTKYYRFWVGPELKVSFNNKLTINTNEQMVNDNNGYFSESGLGDVWGIILGPAVGLNVHLPNKYSFTITAGFLVGNYNGDTDYRTTNGNQYGDLHAQSSGMYLTAGFIYRINE